MSRAIKREKISADAFLACMAYEFPGLVTDAEVSGADLVNWISQNLKELKRNVYLNMVREAAISHGEKVGLKNA